MGRNRAVCGPWGCSRGRLLLGVERERRHRAKLGDLYAFANGAFSCLGPCVDGSRLSRGYRTGAASVGAAMCSAYSCGSHKAAGHNAFRGSGPGQNPAFDNAVAQMGCPDRRIDQSCITCCLPFPTVLTAPSPALFHSPSQQAISRARLAPWTCPHN
jgi:hypothetical protein